MLHSTPSDKIPAEHESGDCAPQHAFHVLTVFFTNISTCIHLNILKGNNLQGVDDEMYVTLNKSVKTSLLIARVAQSSAVLAAKSFEPTRDA